MKRKQILALLLMLSLTQVAPIMGHEVLAKETNESTSGVSSTFANSIKKHMQDVKQNENDIVTGYTTCSVNIRSEPDIKSEVVMILKYGDEIKYIKDDYVTDECNYTSSFKIKNFTFVLNSFPKHLQILFIMMFL